MDLSHLTVLVTGGGGTGVGMGICKTLDNFGAKIIINEITYARAESAAKQYSNAIPIEADISKGEEVEKMFEFIGNEIGTINGLVNNAGVGLTKAVHEIKEEEFDRVYGVNIRGMWLVTKFFVQQLLTSRSSGNIVNVSSVHAHSSQPNYSTYASSKSAVEGFTRATAYKLGAKNIRCNAIAPGYVQSEQNFGIIEKWVNDPQQWAEDFKINHQALHHFIEAEDCGNTACFLLSGLSRSITGQTIYVDAGKTIMLFNRDYIDQKEVANED